MQKVAPLRKEKKNNSYGSLGLHKKERRRGVHATPLFRVLRARTESCLAFFRTGNEKPSAASLPPTAGLIDYERALVRTSLDLATSEQYRRRRVDFQGREVSSATSDVVWKSSG